MDWCSGLTSRLGVWLGGGAAGSIPRSAFVFLWWRNCLCVQPVYGRWYACSIIGLHPVKLRYWRVQTVLENWSKAHLETILFTRSKILSRPSRPPPSSHRPCCHWDPYYTRFLTTLSHRNFLILYIQTSLTFLFPFFCSIVSRAVHVKKKWYSMWK